MPPVESARQSEKRRKGPYHKPQKELSKQELELRESYLEMAVHELAHEKNKHCNGRVPFGFVNKLIQDLRKNDFCRDITRHTIYNELNRLTRLGLVRLPPPRPPPPNRVTSTSILCIGMPSTFETVRCNAVGPWVEEEIRILPFSNG